MEINCFILKWMSGSLSVKGERVSFSSFKYNNKIIIMNVIYHPKLSSFRSFLTYAHKKTVNVGKRQFATRRDRREITMRMRSFPLLNTRNRKIFEKSGTELGKDEKILQYFRH